MKRGGEVIRETNTKKESLERSINKEAQMLLCTATAYLLVYFLKIPQADAKIIITPATCVSVRI